LNDRPRGRKSPPGGSTRRLGPPGGPKAPRGGDNEPGEDAADELRECGAGPGASELVLMVGVDDCESPDEVAA
jgi:hypothetical protein